MQDLAPSLCILLLHLRDSLQMDVSLCTFVIAEQNPTIRRRPVLLVTLPHSVKYSFIRSSTLCRIAGVLSSAVRSTCYTAQGWFFQGGRGRLPLFIYRTIATGRAKPDFRSDGSRFDEIRKASSKCTLC